MNTFSKILAFAILGAGAALIAPASPSFAQTARQLPGIIVRPTPVPVCCTAAQRPVNTNNTWTVTPPSGPAHQAVPVTSTPSWHVPFSGSQWIGPDANAGTDFNEPSGDYVYSYHFCLCGPPKGVGLDFFPAALYLSSYADNSFHAFLNNHPIGQDVLVNGFTVATVIPSTQSSYFQNGDNEIKYVVNNVSGPTGLDVSGWISGYFQPLGPDGHCPR
jgi:hypothetical protein